jgi:hypothetical protein
MRRDCVFVGAGAASIANLGFLAVRERLASQNENMQKKTKRLAELKLHRPHRLERKLAAYQTMVIDCLCWLACAYTWFVRTCAHGKAYFGVQFTRASPCRDRGACKIPPGVYLYILVKCGFTDAFVRVLSRMHEYNQQIIKSNPRIELGHGTSDGCSPSISSSLDSERLACMASPVVSIATTPVGDIVLRGPTTPPRNDVASGSAHTRRSDHEKFEVGGKHGAQMSARRPLFDTRDTSVRITTDAAEKWGGQKSAIKVNDSATVLIGSGRVVPAGRSSRVQCLERANVGDFFRVWSVNLKFVLLTAHEGIDAHWDFMSQMFADQALFFQVGLRVVLCDCYRCVRCKCSVTCVIRVRMAF